MQLQKKPLGEKRRGCICSHTRKREVRYVLRIGGWYYPERLFERKPGIDPVDKGVKHN